MTDIFWDVIRGQHLYPSHLHDPKTLTPSVKREPVIHQISQSEVEERTQRVSPQCGNRESILDNQQRGLLMYNGWEREEHTEREEDEGTSWSLFHNNLSWEEYRMWSKNK